jgi:integrase
VHDLADAIVKATSRPQPQYRTLVLMLAATGIRFGEAVGLTVRDLDLARLHNGTHAPLVHIRRTVSPVNGRLVEGLPKSGKVRKVAVPPYLAAELGRLVEGRKPDDRVFTSPRGQVLRERTFTRFHWRPAVESIGCKGLVPHELRHTAATEMLRRGIPITAVANQLGHASPEITARVYSHLLEEDLTVIGEALESAFSEIVSERRRNSGPNLRAV